MSRPSFQWYPKDWRGNTKLRRCTWAQRGMWVEVIGLLHDSDEYGILRWPLKEIANSVGCPLKDLQELRAKGVLKGAEAGEECPAYVYVPFHAGKHGTPVELIPAQPGPIWFSSRLVKDEYKRQIRATKGGMGEDESPPPKPPIGAGSGPPPSRAGARAGASSSSSSSMGSIKDIGSVQASTGPESETRAGPALSPKNAEHEIAGMRGAMAKNLRDEGITNVTPSCPLVVEWVDRGITIQTVREAVDMARQRKPKPEAISINYLRPIVEELVKPPAQRNGLNGHGAGKPWFIHSSTAIEEKGRELQVEHQPDETFPDYKARVFAAAGITADQVATATKEWR